VVEELHDVLDDDDHLVGRLAVAGLAAGGDARGRVDEVDGHRLGATAPLDDGELDALAVLESRHTLRQRARGHKDVAALVAADEAEPLVGVEELDLAGGHVGPLRVGWGMAWWAGLRRSCAHGRLLVYV